MFQKILLLPSSGQINTLLVVLVEAVRTSEISENFY
jgi:hypothetical protein